MQFCSQIESLKIRLNRLREVVERDYPKGSSAIPSDNGIDMKKLGKHGVVMSDSCNAALETKLALQLVVGGITTAIDCFCHLRNT